jgi:hypothetical protein
MNDKVRLIASAKKSAQPDAEIVQYLEELLAKAKAGDIRDIVVVFADKDEFDSKYKLNDDHWGMLGYGRYLWRLIEEDVTEAADE